MKKLVDSKINEISNSSKRTNKLLFSLLESCTKAPPFRPIEDYSELMNGYRNMDHFANDMVVQYKHKTLVQYIGDFIVKHYHKTDPRHQSVFNCDTARYNYKYLHENQSSQWLSDKGGIKMNTIAIHPIIIQISEAVKQKFTVEYLTKLTNINNPNLVYDIELWNHSMCLQRDIHEGKLSKQVLRYVSPYLHLTRDQELTIEKLDYSRLIMME